MGMIEALLLSPYVWIPLLIVFLGLEAYLVENKSPGMASLVFICTLAFLQMFTSIAPFTLIVANPFAAFGILAGYVMIGMAVTYVKWRSYVNRQMEALSEHTEKALASEAAWFATAETSDDLAQRRKKVIDKAISDVLGYETLPIQIRKHKVRATTWMAYWPVSALYYVFDDPVRRVFQYCYRQMSGVLQDYSDKAAADYDSKYR